MKGKGYGAGSVDVTDCNTRMEALKDRLRYIKNHWFLKPPLVDPDFTALLIPVPDQTKTPVPPPAGFAEGLGPVGKGRAVEALAVYLLEKN